MLELMDSEEERGLTDIEDQIVLLDRSLTEGSLKMKGLEEEISLLIGRITDKIARVVEHRLGFEPEEVKQELKTPSIKKAEEKAISKKKTSNQKKKPATSSSIEEISEGSLVIKPLMTKE